MAVRDNLTRKFTSFEEHWDGHTGQEVETFITEKLIDADNNQITGGTYEGTKLTLNRKGENVPPIEIQVLVADPVYTFNIFVYGLVLNGNYSDIKRAGNSLVTQYSSGKTFHLGVALVAYTDTVGNKNNLTAPQTITISYGNDHSANFTVIPTDYNKVVVNNEGVITGFADGVDPITDIAWIDITKLFTESYEGALTASYSIEAKSGGAYQTFTGSYTLPIATIKNEVVNLSYSSKDVINGTTIAEFTTDRNNSDYRLQGFVIKNNNTSYPEAINIDNLSYTNLVPGLNQFVVKAVNRNNPDVYTDYISVDIICTVGLDHAVAAVNNVRNTIANNGVAELYALTIFSPTGGDNISIDTYVTDSLQLNEDEIPTSSLVKSDVVSDSSYEERTDGYVFTSNYQKYMEITGGGEQYLYIKIGDTWYKFLTVVNDNVYANTYRDMVVEALDNNLTYYPSGVSLSFDQIKGCVNNVFKTKEYFPQNYNVNPSLEVSDGWVEEDGRNIFRVSAQATPVFEVPLPLNLQDQFTLEFGFKSYNLSNTHAPVITIGSLQLRPLELCWDVNATAQEELINDTFTARNSQFQEDVETHIVMTVKKGAKITDDGIYYPDYLDIYGGETNLTKLNNQSINLVRIYINGGIDREYILKDDELNALKAASMQINPTGSDMDFYVLRVYNATALNFDQVKRNYLSFLKSKESKLAFYNANDILGTNGEISFNKCLGKYNTIVYVLPAGYKTTLGTSNDTGRFPNRAWGYQNNSPAQDNVMKKAKVSMFINYAPDPNVPNKNKIYGGRLDNMQIKSQGSSAERYLIWNVGSQMDKFKDGNGKKIKSMFTPYSNLDSNNRFVENPTNKTNYYIMPYYQGEVDQTEYQAKKFVGKVNFASSMQSHKLGASRLYDDAFKNNAIEMPKTIEGATYGSKKAPHDEPFLYFYWEPDMDNDQVAQCDLADIIAAGSQVKFMGFHTWGPAKTDKAYMGINDNVPEYFIVEGGENKDVAVNFRVPWHALQRANKDENELVSTDLLQYQLEYAPTTDYNPNESWKRLLIHDESICYSGTSGAWDVDCGLEGDAIIESDDGVTSFWKVSEKAHNSINRFRAFYDFVYSHDYTFNVCAATNPDPNNSTSTDEFGNPVLDEFGDVSNKWDVTKKYLVTSNTSPIAGYTEHRPFDIYRYENYSKQWVPAGISYDRVNNRWNRLTIWDMSGLNTTIRDIDANRNAIKRRIWGTWSESGTAMTDGKKGNTRVTDGEIAQYINLQDIAFHQALVKLLSGTDNRAKNTYFQMVGPLYHTVEVSPAEYYTQEEIDNAVEGDDAFGKTTSDVKVEAVTSFEPIDPVGSQAYEDSYKLRMFGWDLDTVIITDNNGLQTKPYNLVEASYNHDHDRYWGDAHNIFFYMFDQGYEDYIKQQLRGILKFAFSDPKVTNSGNYFYMNFFDIQDNKFPAVAYNHQAKIYYENAQFIFDSHIIDVYTNNNVDVPLSQSHGSAAPCEKQFMQKRYDFLASYALIVKGQDKYNFTSSTGGSGVNEARLRLQFVPYQDFYPTYYWNRDDNFKYLGILEESQFDTNKYLARTGHSYDIKLHETDQGINNALQSLNKFKELTITGIQNRTLSVQLQHNTDFKIDNAIKEGDTFFQGWADTVLDIFSPEAPVLENLSLRNMDLPSQIDLSQFYKLKKVDFTGTNVNYVILPQSGRLETVILPTTITEFRLYNNPGIKATVNETVDNELVQEGIVLPNPSGLRTVYVNGANAGQFNVSAFCTSIANANLTNLTLRNVNIRITEATLNALMATPKCSISGKIVIVDNSDTLAAISFNTLQSLVNKFGDIRSESNGLYVQFVTVNTQIVSTASTIALYNKDAEAQVTPIIDGNDIKIIVDATADSGYRLDINYYLRTSRTYSGQARDITSNFPTGIASINSTTGKIVLKQTSLDKGYAFVRITNLANEYKLTSSSNNCEVTFSWVAPKIGDFAYEDGTFSSSFISSKALMGLVYAVKATDDNSGTAYIIGKEYAFKNSQTGEPIATYMGLTMEIGRQAQDRYQTSTYYLNRYAGLLGIVTSPNTQDQTSQLFTTGLNSVVVRDLSTIGKVDAITYSTYGVSHMSDDEFDHFTGKDDTTVYINAVNRFVLPKLRQFYANASHSNSTIVNNLESYGSDGYYKIANNDALNKVYNALYSMSIKYEDTTYDGYSAYVQTGLATAVIFPYVYAMHVYQPEATSLDSQYEAGNWYMPSLAQLQRVIYHRGISARTTGSDQNFNQPSYVMLNISGVAKTSGSIFSSAYNAITSAGGKFPQCWQNLIGYSENEASVSQTASNSYNLVTALSANGNNYGYQNTTGNGNNYSSNQNWSMKWISGQMPVEGSYYTTYVDYPGSYNTWSLYDSQMPRHLGIPFVEFDYSRP